MIFSGRTSCHGSPLFMLGCAGDVGRDSADEVLDDLVGVVVAMGRVTKNSIPVLDVYILRQHVRWSYQDPIQSRKREQNSREEKARIVGNIR